jgi:hypothetical protein
MVGYVARSQVSDGAASDQSYLCVAVTQTGDPTGAWNRYSFNVEVTAGSDEYWMDFPQAAVWRDALYVSGNYFLFSGGFSQFTRVYALDKVDLYAGTAANAVFQENPIDQYGFSVFTVQPAKAGAAFPAGGPAYFVAFQNLDCSGVSCPELNTFTMSPNFGAGTTGWARIASLPVSGAAMPVNVPQAGSVGTVQANDVRLLDVQWYTDNSLYTGHTVGCNPGSGTVDCVRWYQVHNLSTTPALRQQGTLAGNGEYRFFPDLAVDSAGNMAVAYSFSTNATQVGIRFTGRAAGDPVGATAPDVALFAGQAVYANNFAGSPHRWGDYTALVVDPDDACVLWYVGEYAQARVNPDGPNWGTRIGSLSFPGCSTASATATATSTPVSTATATATASATPTASATSTPTATASATPTPTATASPPPAGPTSCAPAGCLYPVYLPLVQR